MRHDALAAAGDFQPFRPPGNVHPEGAPRSGVNKDLDTLIVPGQEHLSMPARRPQACPREFSGLDGVAAKYPPITSCMRYAT